MPYSETPNFEIKMLQQERIKGPLPRVVATAGSAVKFDFFFTLSTPPQEAQQTNQPTTVPQDQKTR